MFSRNLSDTAPLTPYQRPAVAALYVALAFLVLFFASYLLLNIEWFADRYRHKPAKPSELNLATFTTSSTTNNRLIALDHSLKKLDEDAKSYFGPLHYWHNPKEEPAPKQIYHFNDYLQDSEHRFLRLYEKVATTRNTYKEAFRQLEEAVDGSVANLGPNTTADAKLRAVRLLEIDLSSALGEVDEQIMNLKLLGNLYKEKDGKPW